MFLKPNPNKTVEGNPLQVFDPERRSFMPADGAAVPANEYWIRRLRDGDCVEYDPKDVAAVPDDLSDEEKLEAAIAGICDRFEAANFVLADTPEGQDQKIGLIDQNDNLIEVGTLAELTAIADKRDADKAAAKKSEKKNPPAKKKGK